MRPTSPPPSGPALKATEKVLQRPRAAPHRGRPGPRVPSAGSARRRCPTEQCTCKAGAGSSCLQAAGEERAPPPSHSTKQHNVHKAAGGGAAKSAPPLLLCSSFLWALRSSLAPQACAVTERPGRCLPPGAPPSLAHISTPPPLTPLPAHLPCLVLHQRGEGEGVPAMSGGGACRGRRGPDGAATPPAVVAPCAGPGAGDCTGVGEGLGESKGGMSLGEVGGRCR